MYLYTESRGELIPTHMCMHCEAVIKIMNKVTLTFKASFLCCDVKKDKEIVNFILILRTNRNYKIGRCDFVSLLTLFIFLIFQVLVNRIGWLVF